jgi:hypothetical protein
MQSLKDRARENMLELLTENRRIMRAMESGTQVNWSAEELARMKALVTELEALLRSEA